MTRQAETGASDELPPLVEGKYAILAVLALGLIGAIGAWAYRGQLQRKAIAFFGPEHAVLIQRAAGVTLMRLAPAESDMVSDMADDDRQTLDVVGRPFVVAERVEAGQAPGLIHLRSSLISDRSYDWSASPDSCKPEWKFALKFTDDSQRSATIVLDIACNQLLLLEADRQISMKPMAAGLKKFLAAQFDQFDRHRGSRPNSRKSPAAIDDAPPGQGPLNDPTQPGLAGKSSLIFPASNNACARSTSR